MTKRFGPHGFYDEAKLTRLMEVLERNIEADIATEAPLLDAVTLQPKPRPPKPDRTLEQTLLAELTNAERKELDRLCKAKARECWRAGDNWRKNLWGGF
jgi:hypothetical protein